ncbi:transposase [Streptomyces sp. NPDC060011]|uniref:transposase n=1 Tax=Streptomyces sp. NPDC060011 TaxID=3347037 RepID=UPI0036B3BA9C
MAPVAEPVHRGGEDLPPAPRLPAQTCRGGDGDRGAGTAPYAVTARGTAPHPDHRTHPPPLRRHLPPAGETLDDQRHRPPSQPRPQDRAPLPRHCSRRAAGLRQRAPPQRGPGAGQGISQRSLHRSTRPGQRHPTVPGDPGPRLSRQPPRRSQTPRCPSSGGTAEPVRADIPSPRKITSGVLRPRETLTESQDERLLQVRLACPDITRACDLARAFADMVRHQRGYLLLEWIRQAEQDAPKPMKGFAGFLRQDLDAVTAGLTLPWSSGAVEGNVNRVKTLKRAMYGRASFELLRTRILTRP